LQNLLPLIKRTLFSSFLFNFKKGKISVSLGQDKKHYETELRPGTQVKMLPKMQAYILSHCRPLQIGVRVVIFFSRNHQTSLLDEQIF
jgi:hypothetical protein